MTGAGRTVRVAVVEDHPLYRAAVAGALAAAAGIEVALGCGSYEELRAALPGCADPVDVVLLDLALPGRSGVETVRELTGDGTAVLVLSACDSRREVVEVFAAGAKGYLVKSAEAAEIVAAVRTVARGDTHITPTLAPFLLWAVQRDPHASALSGREREVLVLLARGHTDVQIAELLEIGPTTVRSHLDRVRDKTGARRRADLTRWAVAEGLVEATPPP